MPHEWFLYGPIGYLDGLALGAGLALLPPTARWPREPRWDSPSTAGGMRGWGLPIAQGIAALAGAALVATLKDRLDGWPVDRRLIELGKRSYGAYLIHPIVLDTTMRLASPGLSARGLLVRLVSLGLTLAFAWLSFRYFERPFLALKGRFQRVPSGADAH